MDSRPQSDMPVAKSTDEAAPASPGMGFAASRALRWRVVLAFILLSVYFGLSGR
jgi:hypothetical protein